MCNSVHNDWVSRDPDQHFVVKIKEQGQEEQEQEQEQTGNPQERLVLPVCQFIMKVSCYASEYHPTKRFSQTSLLLLVLLRDW